LAHEPPDASVRPTTPTKTGRRPLLPIVVGLAVVVGFAAAAWYALAPLQPAMQTGEPPLIKADIEPFKEKPSEPGGLQIPNQDKLVFERLTPAAAPAKEEKLAPEPEEPVARPQQADATPASTSEAAPTEATAATPPPPVAPPRAAAESETTMAAAPPAPPPAAGAAADETAGAGAASPAPADSAASDNAEEKTAAAVATTTKTDSGNAAATTDRFRVQIAAYRSEETARSAWLRLRKQHSDVLAELDARIARVEIEGKGTYYRLQAGPFADRAAAGGTCDALKARKLSCFVVKS